MHSGSPLPVPVLLRADRRGVDQDRVASCRCRTLPASRRWAAGPRRLSPSGRAERGRGGNVLGDRCVSVRVARWAPGLGAPGNVPPQRVDVPRPGLVGIGPVQLPPVAVVQPRLRFASVGGSGAWLIDDRPLRAAWLTPPGWVVHPPETGMQEVGGTALVSQPLRAVSMQRHRPVPGGDVATVRYTGSVRASDGPGPSGVRWLGASHSGHLRSWRGPPPYFDHRHPASRPTSRRAT